jgi:hypothetical protein
VQAELALEEPEVADPEPADFSFSQSVREDDQQGEGTNVVAAASIEAPLERLEFVGLNRLRGTDAAHGRLSGVAEPSAGFAIGAPPGDASGSCPAALWSSP